MNAELLGHSWDSLSGKHEELITTFYTRFFEKFPEYKTLFPETLGRQMTKMVETMALVARVTDETEVLHPHLAKVGGKHGGYQLNEEDLEKFKTVFLEVVGEYCGDNWTGECQQAWTSVFDKHVIPHMVQGINYTKN